MPESLDEFYVDNKYGRERSHTLFGTTAQNANNWGVFFHASHAIAIIRVIVSWETNSAGGTLQLQRLAPGVAVGSGDDILSATVSTSSGATTPIELFNTDLTDAARLNPLDRVSLEDAGSSIGSLFDLTVTIYYAPVGRGTYLP